MEITRYSKTCEIKQESNGKVVEAEVVDFKENQKLSVVLAKTVKLSLVWNGRLYEGKMAGLDFVSAGPKVTKATTGR